jgi:transposase
MALAAGSSSSGLCSYVVGIDVAKQSHMVCALHSPSGHMQLSPTRIAATREGYTQVLSWLGTWTTEPASILVGLEATGALWEPLYEALTQAGYNVLVLNPRQTVSWAASLGLRAKTDGADALTLARGLLAGLARASVLPDEMVQSLRTLTRARRDLVNSHSALRQRVQAELQVLFPELLAHLPMRGDLRTPAVVRLLTRYNSAQALAQVDSDTLTGVLAEVSGGRWGRQQAVALQALARPRQSAAGQRALAARSAVVRTLTLLLLDLEARIAELDGLLAQLIAHDDVCQRLQQVPGVGQQNAATIRAELGDVARFAHIDEVVAYAGLDPRTYQSGAYAGQRRMSKRGPAALRYALYLAAVVAVRVGPEWRTRYERLLARGRKKKEALVILSRALLKVLFALLRSQSSYDPARVGVGSRSSPATVPSH